MPKDIEDIYPLSPMQQGMLFHSLRAPEAGLYVEQRSWSVNGALDVDAFEKAWQLLTSRHPVFRTSFVWEGVDEPLQIVHRSVQLPIEHLDWRAQTRDSQYASLDGLLEEDRKQGFEWSVAPLMGLRIIRTGEQEYWIVWKHHHLLLDGWCMPIVFAELLSSYNALQHGRQPVLEPVLPYREYIAWLRKQDMQKAERFWRQLLKGFVYPTRLPRSPRQTSAASYALEEHHLSEQTSSKLQATCRAHGLTMSSVVQSAWALLLNRMTGDRDIVFGTTVSGRPPELRGVEGMIGLFINTLPMRATFAPDCSVLSLLNTVQSQLAEMRQFEYTPLYRIQEWSDVAAGEPLFESIIVFENYPIRRSLSSQHVLPLTLLRTFEKTNYPLTVVFSPAEVLGIEIAYDTGMFNAGDVKLLLERLTTILQGIAEAPTSSLGRIPVVAPRERRELAAVLAGPPVPRGELCIHQVIAHHALRAPDAAAVIGNGRTISYAELVRQADRCAGFLRRHGVAPEDRVGIYSGERTPDAVAAMLGVLNAGAAFVPADGVFPIPRAAAVFRSAGAKVVLVRTPEEKEELQTLMGPDVARVCTIDESVAAVGGEAPEQGVPCAPGNLAYLIFTSGSTGEPKGVMVEHGGLLNLVEAERRDWHIDSGSRVVQAASLCFDAAVGEIFSALGSGAAVVIAGGAESGSTLTEGLLRLMKEQQVTHATLSPALLSELSREVDEGGVTGAPRQMLQVMASVGEACPVPVARWWAERSRAFFNGYGPTEGTIGASWHRIRRDDPDLAAYGFVPLGGAPLRGTTFYVLDPALEPVGTGMQGELYLAGRGVARGYAHRPDLTAERFLPDPFAGERGARMYRTGDLVRLHAGGRLLEYLGRSDQQLKLRGFRIEAGEVEQALLRAAEGILASAAVMVLEEDDLLAAYCEMRTATSSTDDLRNRITQNLSGKLPGYMIPALYSFTDTMPRLPASGKVDRREVMRRLLQHRAEEKTNGKGHASGRIPQDQYAELLGTLWQAVLGLKRMPLLNEDFFALGGHSLRVTQLVSRLREATGRNDIPLEELFSRRTLREQAAYLRQTLAGTQQRDAAASIPLQPRLRTIVEPAEEEEIPLSFAQQRLWFIDQLEPGSTSYNVTSALRVTGPLDAGILRDALRSLVGRHEVLRTRFVQNAGSTAPSQSILPIERWMATHEADAFAVFEVPAGTNSEEYIRSAIADMQHHQFDLSMGPLILVRLVRCAADDHALILGLHHCVTDGWSMSVLVSELSELYAAHAHGRVANLKPLAIQYGDYALWQRSRLAAGSPVLARDLAYWRSQLSGIPEMLALPTDFKRPALKNLKGLSVASSFISPPRTVVNALCVREGVTPFMVFLAAFQALLSRYSAQQDIVVGSPVAGRTDPAAEGLIGFFVNTLVLRSVIAGSDTFRSLLRKVRTTCLGAYTHQEVPFELLVEELKPGRDLSHTPLFQVMCVYQNAPRGTLLSDDLAFSAIPIPSDTCNYDLVLVVEETNDGYRVDLEYDAALFAQDTIERMLVHFRNELSWLVLHPERAVLEAPLLTPGEKEQLTEEWNATAVPLPDSLDVPARFAEITGRQPNDVALVYAHLAEGNGSTLERTYRRLHEESNQVAWHLLSLGVRPETLVGVCMERSFEMITAILGVLKAGAAFVPLDPLYPAERLHYMMNDAGIRVLLTQQILVERLPETEARILCLDTEWGVIATEPLDEPGVPLSPDQLAYVIYTSGSTGTPKGTMLNHRGLINLSQAQQRAFGITPGSRIFQFSSLSFDAAVWEIVMALLNGATLCLVHRGVSSNITELARSLRTLGVTNITLPPSVLALLPQEPFPDLRTIITAGEACPAALVNSWSPGRSFFNAYGPTETTVCAAMYQCPENIADAPPIGRPIANFQLYVLDPLMQPVPVGVPAELYIGGIGLARGYLNRPELTAERFVPDPFSKCAGARLYRSGDLCRFLPDGTIAFEGRVDQQVKLRGFRIELGEVEHALMSCPGVREAAATVYEEQGDRRLVGFVVPDDPAASDMPELRGELRDRLPEYMIPSVLAILPALPHTPSGKVDRAALPRPTGERPSLGSTYIAPRNDAEERLAAIAAELLHLDRVGVEDSFFDLGGHSLLATQFISRVREAFGIDVPLRILFESPTVARFAVEMERIRNSAPAAQRPALRLIDRKEVITKRSRLEQGAPPAVPNAHTTETGS